MNPVLERWNAIDAESAAQEILPCCGSTAWAAGVSVRREIVDEEHLLAVSDAVWLALPEAGWQEAFDSHPRIGERRAKAATAESLAWSGTEQSRAMDADAAAKLALEAGNRRYEEKFGHIFIVCASERTAAEILANLESRMSNDAETEFREAAEQQRQITQLRLRRWLGGN